MGFTIKEISEIMDISYDNAKKRLQRAKYKFKKSIKEYMEYAD